MQELYVSGAENAAQGLLSPASLLELHVLSSTPVLFNQNIFKRGPDIYVLISTQLATGIWILNFVKSCCRNMKSI